MKNDDLVGVELLVLHERQTLVHQAFEHNRAQDQALQIGSYLCRPLDNQEPFTGMVRAAAELTAVLTNEEIIERAGAKGGQAVFPESLHRAISMSAPEGLQPPSLDESRAIAERQTQDRHHGLHRQQ